jgi:hypothetical protein
MSPPFFIVSNDIENFKMEAYFRHLQDDFGPNLSTKCSTEPKTGKFCLGQMDLITASSTGARWKIRS